MVARRPSIDSISPLYVPAGSENLSSPRASVPSGGVELIAALQHYPGLRHWRESATRIVIVAAGEAANVVAVPFAASKLLAGKIFRFTVCDAPGWRVNLFVPSLTS